MTERRGRGGQARQGTRALGDAAHARLLAWLCRAGLKAGPSMLNYIPDLVYMTRTHTTLFLIAPTSIGITYQLSWRNVQVGK